MAATLKLLTISHSYVVAANRRLAHELAVAGRGRWEVTAVAPDRYVNSNDGQIIEVQPAAGEASQLVVCPARLPGSPHLFHYGRGFKELLRGPWDVIHAWEEPYVCCGGQVARHAPTDAALIFATFQNISKRYPPPFGWLERFSMCRAAAWIAFGHSAHSALQYRAGYADRPMRVIPPGVDIARLRPDRSAGLELRRELGWQENDVPVLGLLGRLVPAKGVDTIFEALARVVTPWRLLVVGDGPLKSEVADFQGRYPDQVRHCSGVQHDRIGRYLNAMDVLVAPSKTTSSWREQFGRMITEAFACGVPVIGSDSGEIPHVVGNCGFVVPEKDVGAWERSISRLLADVGERDELGRQARLRAEQVFAWPLIASRTLEFFSDVLTERRQLSR